MTNDRTAVAMIGLGPMGQAMTRALLAAGHPVTVWNRTAARADGVVAAGAARAATPSDALGAAELVVLSLTDYAAMYDILSGHEDALAGRTVVNLSSDTPDRTREAARWFTERGARLLVGGIMVPAEVVGTPDAFVYYSGPREVLDAHAAALGVIGRPEYLGADPGLAQLYYQAVIHCFLSALAAFLHASAMVATAGVSAKEFLPHAVAMADSISSYLPEAAGEFDARDYPGEQASVAMMGAGAEHVLETSRAAGVDTTLPEAVASLYRRAVAAGHGARGWTVLSEVVRHDLTGR
ncbi:NAD(P)-dependent oxidoreductase [Pseudonocardia humida]|uniref:NAD(P)-dependent oxidoreductase n=1 Tax=Pseudonocardia humida TaxID=2800819 RepID=A0ABT1A9E5_9PSEU|nr:NAD(P)-binding domain-containing protein [Pseudonocardia humida]MCO1659652.1 NAD(P)-dependent oxidoreductase [Pseudonocardia humida]